MSCQSTVQQVPYDCIAADSRSGKVRITHLILIWEFGGAEKLVQDIAISLQDEWAQSSIICFDAITRNTEPLKQHGIPIELIKREPAVFDLKTCVRVIRRLKAMDPQVIHAHDMTSLVYAVVAGRFLRIPVVMTEHSRHYIEERWIRRMEKWLLCLGVRKLVDVSPELAQASVQRDGLPSSKVAVIENGVDLDHFVATGAERFRSELALGPEEVLVGMVGRLEEIKGPGILLEAFASAVRDVPSVRLAFVGDGSLDQSLKDRCKALGLNGQVDFLGARADIPSIMAGLDVLVLPSLSEGLPFALLEGMAAGRAVVASAVGRIPGIIREEGESANGKLVPPGEPGLLAKKLTALLRDEPLRRRLGLRAREYVERHYDKQIMLKQYQALYDDALCGREPS